MTLVYIGITAAVSLLVGYLLGERRAVREANGILDANMRELFKAIGDERPAQVVDEDEAPRVALH